jgi:hypothetical protein
LVASALVHEAVHARLTSFWTPPDVEERIELRCTLEELEFAQRLPRDRFEGADRYIAYLRDRAAVQREGLRRVVSRSS